VNLLSDEKWITSFLKCYKEDSSWLRGKACKDYSRLDSSRLDSSRLDSLRLDSLRLPSYTYMGAFGDAVYMDASGAAVFSKLFDYVWPQHVLLFLFWVLKEGSCNP
jgi:hypothetical protein